MAELSNSAQLAFFIDGQQVSGITDISSLEVDASYVLDSGLLLNQPSVAITDLVLANQAKQIVLDKIAAKRFYEGIPFKIQAYNSVTSFDVFDGYINLVNQYENLLNNPESPNTIRVSVERLDSPNNINQRLDGVTFGKLQDDGLLSSEIFTNLNYVVEQENLSPFQAALLALQTALLIKETLEFVKDLGKDTATTTGISSSSVTGGIGGTVYAVLSAIVQAIYAATIAIRYFTLAQQIQRAFLPKVRSHRLINYRGAMTAIASFLGLEFESDISELDNQYYLPSNINPSSFDKDGFLNIRGSVKNGIPQISDNGYTCSEFLQIMQSMFYARFAVINGVLQFRSRNSTYWESQASLTLKSTNNKTSGFNASELKQTQVILFATDPKDSYTASNFIGTGVEVTTNLTNVVNERLNLIQGENTVRIPLALATRKNTLNPIENTLKSVLGFFDDLFRTFGVRSNFARGIDSRIGALVVSDNNHSIPKAVVVQNGRIPANHRDQLSALTFWNKYHSRKSFVVNDFGNQKEIITDSGVPFGLNDFVETVENGYVFDSLGKSAELRRFKWNMRGDIASELEYEVSEVFETNLEEKIKQGKDE